MGGGYFSARRVAKLNTRAVACTKLRAAFAPAIATIGFGLKTGGNGELITKAFFDEAILSQASAIEEFRPFVSERIAYEEAWNEYKKIIATTSINDGGAGWDTGSIQSECQETVEYLPIVKQKIDNILEFAAH